jgi:hypothetical protein
MGGANNPRLAEAQWNESTQKVKGEALCVPLLFSLFA